MATLRVIVVWWMEVCRDLSVPLVADKIWCNHEFVAYFCVTRVHATCCKCEKRL